LLADNQTDVPKDPWFLDAFLQRREHLCIRKRSKKNHTVSIMINYIEVWRNAVLQRWQKC